METNSEDNRKAFVDGISTLTFPLYICCIHFREYLIKKLKYHEKRSFIPEELCKPLVTDSPLMKGKMFCPRFLILFLAVVVAFNQCMVRKQSHSDLITPSLSGVCWRYGRVIVMYGRLINLCLLGFLSRGRTEKKKKNV